MQVRGSNHHSLSRARYVGTSLVSAASALLHLSRAHILKYSRVKRRIPFYAHVAMCIRVETRLLLPYSLVEELQ